MICIVTGLCIDFTVQEPSQRGCNFPAVGCENHTRSPALKERLVLCVKILFENLLFLPCVSQQNYEGPLFLLEAVPDRIWGQMKGLKSCCLTWMLCQTSFQRAKLLLTNAQPFSKQIGLEASEVPSQPLCV